MAKNVLHLSLSLSISLWPNSPPPSHTRVSGSASRIVRKTMIQAAVRQGWQLGNTSPLPLFPSKRQAAGLLPLGVSDFSSQTCTSKASQIDRTTSSGPLLFRSGQCAHSTQEDRRRHFASPAPSAETGLRMNR